MTPSTVVVRRYNPPEDITLRPRRREIGPRRGFYCEGMMHWILLLFAFALAGCTTEQARQTMQSEWIGKSSDEFFLTNGPPVSEFKLTDGRRIYTWQSGVKNYNMPPMTSTTVTGSGAFTQVNTRTTGGSSVTVSCTAQLTVQPNGIIVDIKPSEDTIGDWTLSRCAELFPQKSAPA